MSEQLTRPASWEDPGDRFARAFEHAEDCDRDDEGECMTTPEPCEDCGYLPCACDAMADRKMGYR